jgi:hypothetical protein
VAAIDWWNRVSMRVAVWALTVMVAMVGALPKAAWYAGVVGGNSSWSERLGRCGGIQ